MNSVEITGILDATSTLAEYGGGIEVGDNGSFAGLEEEVWKKSLKGMVQDRKLMRHVTFKGHITSELS
jgi:hypothetical protein